jgi:uncharacterized membrane protein YdbT with pleckstrin-like domain
MHMGYIDNNLVPDERIIFKTRKHLIIFLFPLVVSIFAWYSYNYMQVNPILNQLDWIPGAIALLFWIYAWLEYRFSEFAVTNKRVMMREGFFVRHANELRLSAIAQVNIDQSLLGQLLGYGVVRINAFGAADAYPIISNPAGFQKAVNEQLDKVVR